MGLEDQAAVKRVADEHGRGVVVLLGTPDAESTQTLAQTVVVGDPSYAGPLAGVPLGLPVLHVLEPDVKDQVPADVYEAQVALMEMSLDRDAILAGLGEARRVAKPVSEEIEGGRGDRDRQSGCCHQERGDAHVNSAVS
jgi:hypothetical protein